MGKIEKLLDKTKRDGETNRWVIYAVAVVAIITIVAGTIGVYSLILSPILNTYIADKPISHLYDFYDLNIGENQTAVFFIGNSQIGADVYIPLVQEELNEKGYENILAYNLYQSSDTPVRRSIALEKIINSKPSLIIYGVSPWVFSEDNDGWVDEDVILVNKRLLLNHSADYLYSESELNDLKTNTSNFFYMKRFLLNALKHYIFENTTISDPITYTTKEIWGEWKTNESRIAYSNTFGKNGVNLEQYIILTDRYANTSHNRISLTPFTGKNNTKLQAFEYILKRFEEEHIPVVLVIMPDHSFLAKHTPKDSPSNFIEYVNHTGLPWYNLNEMYGDEIMADLTHANWDGAVTLSPQWADIIIQELS